MIEAKVQTICHENYLESFNQLFNQSINQSVNQSVRQSFIHITSCKLETSSKYLYVHSMNSLGNATCFIFIINLSTKFKE